jgi:hypothetical protein
VTEKPEAIDEAELARRASDLLKSFFTTRPDLRQTALDRAFLGCRKDPRGLIDASARPMAFAVECVSKLLAFGCIDGHRHSLGRLLAVIREDFLGLNPDPDYLELPRLLDGPCLLPSRDEERAYLGRLLAEIERQAALYAPLRGIARIAPGKTIDPQLGAWDDLTLRSPDLRESVLIPSMAQYQALSLCVPCVTPMKCVLWGHRKNGVPHVSH